ncbi:MAG: 3-oxoacyl-ACP synthase [Crocinitomicaceae bacterium]
MPKPIKKKLLNYCFDYLQEKQNNLLDAISDSKNSLDSESQSTAGDKHDTSRAMMHLEIEKKSHQLNELLKLKKVLNQINIEKSIDKVGLGSVIETDKGSFFIAINAGKAKIDSIDFTIISLASPLAQSLAKGINTNSVIVMNRQYRIKSLY